MKLNLTAENVKKLKPKETVYEARDRSLKGFMLRVHPSGRKTWLIEHARGRKYSIATTDKLTAGAARKAARGLLAAAALGKDPGLERKKRKAATLAAFLDSIYEPWMTTRYKRGSGQARRIRAAFPELLEKRLHEITAWQVEKKRSQRLKEGISRATVNRDCFALKAALKRACEWGLIAEHPLAAVKPLAEDTRGRVRYLSPAEEARLRDALDAREEKIRAGRDRHNAWRRERDYKELPDLRAVAFADRLKPLVLIALNSGLRRGELFDLRWRDVDLGRATLVVEGSTSKTHTTRHIPINSEAREILTGWKDQSKGAGYVFPSDDGGRLDNINKSWKTLIEAAGIRNFRFHDTRHSFASNLVMSGADLATVRELLGHSDIAMTLRYSHLSPERKAEAVERLVGRAAQREAAKRVKG